MKRKKYKKELYDLQIELVKFQKEVIEKDLKVCIIFEGRDTAGKDGIIKRFLQHLSPREVRSVALGIPSSRDKKSWYFQRYVPHLPSSQEIILFNRSWYNRAGVERVMNFCTDKELKCFFNEVSNFEQMLNHSGVIFFKYYLDISKDEQRLRLKDRKTDPLKQWKISPIDEKAEESWEKYSKARDDMFIRTSFAYAPWYVVNADDKREARINVIKHFLSNVEYAKKNEKLLAFDRDIVCKFDQICYEKGLIKK
ncbi:polyphosphate kinase 2 [Arcobacter caeni]|uniref:ADP/GDP-polyphosphate phosphotransferase n=1 Tax=Arcobacter caeni TaxID=1912877 RepID=A0A363D391_9BACT|nr:polyphosphate kinase 2 [Arcobacter caeni]PUE65779.1 polyphosphate kinase 2 [Arcobacter caeni]